MLYTYNKGQRVATFKGYCRPCKQIFKMVSLGKGLNTYASLYSFVTYLHTRLKLLTYAFSSICMSKCFTPSQLGLFLISDHLMVKHSRLINFILTRQDYNENSLIWNHQIKVEIFTPLKFHLFLLLLLDLFHYCFFTVV